MSLVPPVPLLEWVAAHTGPAPSTDTPSDSAVVLCGPRAVDDALRGFEFRTSFHTGGDSGAARLASRELFLYQITAPAGSAATVELTSVPSGERGVVALPPGSVLLVPGGGQVSVRVTWPVGGVGMQVGLG